MESKKIMREVPVALSAQELAERGKRWSAVTDEVLLETERFDQMKREHKSVLATLELEASKLRDTLKTGKEKQKREVLVIMDFPRNRVAYMLDGVEVDERVMDGHERQMAFDDGEPDVEEKTDPKMAAANDKSFAEDEKGPLL